MFHFLPCMLQGFRVPRASRRVQLPRGRSGFALLSGVAFLQLSGGLRSALVRVLQVLLRFQDSLEVTLEVA